VISRQKAPCNDARAFKHFSRFYTRRNARIASAVLATAIPSVCLSARLSLRLSHAGIFSKQLHVGQCSATVQFALSHSKVCLVL